MESLKRNAILCLVCITLVLAYMVHHEHNSSVRYKKQSAALENTVSMLNQKAEVVEIKLNDSLAIKQAEVATLKVTNKNLQANYGQLLKASGTKAKDIQTIVQTQTTTSGTDTVICLVDSFGGLTAHWNDQFVDIKVDIDSTKKAIVDYTIKDSLTIINYQKCHSILFGLIKWKSYSGCKVITHNPKATPIAAVSYDTIK